MPTTDPVDAEGVGNMELAVLMMAKEMREHGGFDEVLMRPAVRCALRYAYPRVMASFGVPPSPEMLAYLGLDTTTALVRCVDFYMWQHPELPRVGDFSTATRWLARFFSAHPQAERSCQDPVEIGLRYTYRYLSRGAR